MSDSRLLDAQTALARGDAFTAYDISTAEDGVGDPDLAYVEVRALAQLGNWKHALERYAASGLDQRYDTDSLALYGRLLKDRAFAAPPAERPLLFREASEAYASVLARNGGYYAAINAASMAAMAGDVDRSRTLAEVALNDQAVTAPVDYWAAVTAAEALLLLDRMSEVEATLKAAVTLPGASISARSSTYRQLCALLKKYGQEEAVVRLAHIRPPRIAHFCGHMFAPDPALEEGLVAEIDKVLEEEGIGIAYGALARGSDILVAERCLARGIELHVVMPFAQDDFIEQSVRDRSGEWERRFAFCLSSATQVYQASAMSFVGDDEQFVFGSSIAMGLTRLRATQLGSETMQIALWDGAPSIGPAGTGSDVKRWRAADGRTRQISVDGIIRTSQALSSVTSSDRASRALRVLIFTDFKGFSKLPEPVIPLFWRDVMGRCAEQLETYRSEILCQNSWGDALYLAMADVRAAASLLIELEAAMNAVSLESLGMLPGSGMRIAAHYGSVYEIEDPLIRRLNFYGSEVSRAARVEPVTPPGQVYVTEPMAAAIEMACRDSFVCRYVGRLILPKAFGIERIYRLLRAE